MAIRRVTIPRSIMGKINTQCGKQDNADVANLLKQAQKTESPVKDTILWGPEKELLSIVTGKLV